MSAAHSPKALLLLRFAVGSLYGDELENRISSLESRMTAVKTQTVKNTQGAQLAPPAPSTTGTAFSQLQIFFSGA